MLPPGVRFCQHCGEAGVLYGVLLLEEAAFLGEAVGDRLPVCLAELADFVVDGDGADFVPRPTWNRVYDRALDDLFLCGLCSCPRCRDARGPVQ